MADLKNRIILESSYPDVLAQLLFEEVEDAAKAITAVQKAFQTRNTQLASLVNSLPSGKYKDGLSAFVKSVEEGTDQASKKVDQVDTDNDKAADQVNTISKSYEQLNATVKQVLDVNIALMSNLAKTILDSNLHKGPNKNIPMIQILEESDLVDSANKELSDAFDSSGVKPIKKPKGFLANIFSKSFGETEEAVELANEVVEQKDSLIGAVLEMTPIEIGQFAQAIVNYGKTDESAASQIETATETASEEAENDPNAKASEEGGDEQKGSISKKDLIDKVRNNPKLGDGGAIVLDRIIATGLFDDLGIKLTESLVKRTMASFLFEAKIGAEEFQTAYRAALEADLEKLKDTSPGDIASELNSVFDEENIDVQIEVPKEIDLESYFNFDEEGLPEDVKDEIESGLEDTKKAEVSSAIKEVPFIDRINDGPQKKEFAKLSKPRQIENLSSLIVTLEKMVSSLGLSVQQAGMKASFTSIKQQSEELDKIQQQVEKELNTLVKTLEEEVADGKISASVDDPSVGEEYLKKYGKGLIDLLIKRQEAYNKINDQLTRDFPGGETMPIDEFMGGAVPWLGNLSDADIRDKMNRVVNTIILAIGEAGSKDKEGADLEEEVDEAAESLEKEEPEIASFVDEATKEDKDLEKEVILRLIRPVDISSLPGDSKFKDQAADQQQKLEEFVVNFFKAVKKVGRSASGGKSNSLSQDEITKYAKVFSQYAEKRDDLLMKHQTSVDGEFRFPNPFAKPAVAAKSMIFSIAAALDALDEEAEDAVNKAISDNSWTRIQKTITGEGVEQEAHLSRLQKLAGIL